MIRSWQTHADEKLWQLQFKNAQMTINCLLYVVCGLAAHRKIRDFKIEGEVSDGEEHDLLEECPEQVILDVTPEHDPDLHLAVLLLREIIAASVDQYLHINKHAQ